MEKLKSMNQIIIKTINNTKNFVLGLFLNHPSQISKKVELNKENLVKAFFGILVIFIVFGLFAPNNDVVVFSEIKEEVTTEESIPKNEDSQAIDSKKKTAHTLWNGNSGSEFPRNTQTEINYNTSMVLGSKKGNARDQLNTGFRIRLQNIDKFIVSNDGTPVIAKVVEPANTDSGYIIPEGSVFYGEASYNKGSEKAEIKFNRVSFPNGRILDLQAIAIDSTGQKGLEGSVKSDAIKNSTGQVITSFIGSLAAGSVSRDIFGQSVGGIENGLMQAVADTAKERTNQYGEKMKEAREWIEIESGIYFDAVIIQNINLKPELNEEGSYE